MNNSNSTPFPQSSDSPMQSVGMIVYGSNDPGILAACCAEGLIKNPLGPFEEEEFLVQSRGMGTWLKLNLANKLGIFGRSKFRFPEETISLILRGFLGAENPANPYTKEGMAWAIYEILTEIIRSRPDSFSPLISYLGSGWEENRAFRLSRQIATVFDSYLTYRPEMILDWSRGESPRGPHAWQAILWRELRSKMDKESLPELVWEMKKLTEPRNPTLLPKRISAFGISTLPPLFLDVLQSYGRVCPLHIYNLQPAPLMWGDVNSEKWKLRALNRIKNGNRSLFESDLHIETGNPLIGSLGRTGRDFFNLLVDRDAHDFALEDRMPVGDSILSHLQRWIFEVFEEKPASLVHFQKNDHSLVVKSCHSPMREAEVLRDFLLHRFAEDSSLQPRDVLVMMPSPEQYAPYIRATFGEREDNQPSYFPYSIVDREPRQESQLVNFFFNLLEFFEGRASNRDVIDLLDSLPLRTRFDLNDDDIDQFRKWIRECNVHWGLDAEHRKFIGSTASTEHTWRHALDRMALGYCMRANDTRTWSDVMPYDEMEGGNTILFAKLFQVVDMLRKFQESSRTPKTLKDWKGFLGSLTQSFFPNNNETLLDRQRIYRAVGDLDITYSKLAPHSAVPLRVIRYHLNNVVESGSPHGQFLTQGVTFCGLRPMRSVNARIICMIGMNDGAFPRQTQSASFDLSGDRRAGDRSAREDDRYLFLESIWCARDHLYLSYIGQSIRQAEKIPPSVVINELLDALDKVCDFGTSGNQKLSSRDRLIEHQSLHPFSVENFSGKRLSHSFSSDHCSAAYSLIEPSKSVPPFVNSSMTLLEELTDEISIAEFIRFFESPSKYFLVNRLGVSFWEEDGPAEEHEPMTLNNLQKYEIKRRLLGMQLRGEDAAGFYAIEKAKGSLPPGSLGEVWFNDTVKDVEHFWELWGEALQGTHDSPIHFEESIKGTVLRGEIDSVIDGIQRLYRCGVIRPKDRISAWIRHLIFCTYVEDSRITRFFGMEKSKKFLAFQPLESTRALGILSELMEVFHMGTTRPIPFFPSSSYAYQKKLLDTEDPDDLESHKSALLQARKEWEPSEFSYGGPKEGEVSENITCFPEDPISLPEFPLLARKIFSSLIQAQQEEQEL